MRKTWMFAAALVPFAHLGCGPDTCDTGYVRRNDTCVLYGVPPNAGGVGGSVSSTGGRASMSSGGGLAAGETSTETSGASGGTTAGEVSSKGGSTGSGGVTSSSGGKDEPANGGTTSTQASGGAAPSSGGATGGGGETQAKSAEFAATCMTHADCGGPTDYCAYSATEPSYCTASGCDADPSLCPESWICFNVGDFVPGEPHVCVKPPPSAGGDGKVGSPCNTHAECFDGSDYCTFSPTEPPYCSISGCNADATLCPEGWACFNVGDFVPGEPYVCVKPPPAM